MNEMFCFQCEQTAGCTGCTGRAGVCGKSADTAKLQDKLTGALIGLARSVDGSGETPSAETDRAMLAGLFTTITNVNFDPERLAGIIRQGAEVKAKAKALYEAAALKAGKSPETLAGPAA